MSYKYDAGISGEVVVPQERSVRAYSCIGGDSAGSLVITQAGAASPEPTIPIPANQPFGDVLPTPSNEDTAALNAGAKFVFTGTASYVVFYQ